jgi:hypothetical protein
VETTQLSVATHLVALRESLQPARLREKKFSKAERDKAATAGEAMSDGSYPIKTAADVGNAVNDWGRTGSDPTVKAHIITRAKALGATDELPADWDASTKAVRESERLATALRSTSLRESAFPLMEEYDIAAAMRLAGVLWADSQAAGNSDDEAAAKSLASTLKGVLERHSPEVSLIGGVCGCCGPTCCC